MIDFLYSIIIFPLYQTVELIYMVSLKVLNQPIYSILFVSLGISFLCLPLYIIAEKWQESERQIQLKLQPGIKRIKKAFKGDEQYMILSTFYRQNHYHPLMALRSSVSLLIQIPFFIAAYLFISKLEDLKGLSFWVIKDLGSPDSLFNIGTFKINVLPVLMTLINIVSGVFYSKGHPLKEKIQIYVSALIFLVLLYNSPSGLVIYWTMNNLFSLIKNIFYKFKHPFWVLYGCLCFLVALIDWYLLFRHYGFLYRRLILIFVLSIVYFTPLILKGINYCISHPFRNIADNKTIRTRIFLLSCITLAILAGTTLPSYVISSSPMEFSFIDKYNSPLFFLGHSLWQAVGFCIFWPCCIYFLFGKKTQTVMTILGVIICLCSIINAFIFNIDYGTLTNILTFSKEGALKPTLLQALLNFAVIILFIVIILLLFSFNKHKVFYSVYPILIISFLGITCYHSIKIASTYNQYKKINQQNTAQINKLSPVFHLSKTKQNVLVIMLDRAINCYIPTIFEENSELSDEFDGFVYYPNTASYADNTLLGSPAMFGGYDYTLEKINDRKDEALVDKHNEALKTLPTIFHNDGFDVTLTDMSWANYSWIPDLSIFDDTIRIVPTIRMYTDYWIKLHPEASSSSERSDLLKRNFIWFSFLKSMPLFFRDSIYDKGFWWNSKTFFGNLQDVVNNYAVLDYLPELTAFDSDKPTFTYLINELTHEPNYLQYPDYTPSIIITDKGSGKYSQDVHYHANCAAIKRLGEFFKYLKENNIYDNTRIILVADHGAGVETDIAPEQDKAGLPFRIETFNPLLMVKDFNSHGLMITDNTFMTNADTPYIALKNIDNDAVNPFTGNPIYQPEEKQKLYLAYGPGWSPDQHNKNKFKIKTDEWFSVHDDIFNPDNWKQESPYSQEEAE